MVRSLDRGDAPYVSGAAIADASKYFPGVHACMAASDVSNAIAAAMMKDHTKEVDLVAQCNRTSSAWDPTRPLSSPVSVFLCTRVLPAWGWY